MLQRYQKIGIGVFISFCMSIAIILLLQAGGFIDIGGMIYDHFLKPSDFFVTSPVFKEGMPIPIEYTCDGSDRNPPFEIHHIPSEAKSLAILVDDPDSNIGSWTHWMVWNILPTTEYIAYNSVPLGSQVGINDFGRLGYGGPCPPQGEHHYRFIVYALDVVSLDLSPTANRFDVVRVFRRHEIEKTILTGTYRRN